MNTDYASNNYSKWYMEYRKFYNKYNQNNISEPCLS